MVTGELPAGLGEWREAPRVRALNDRAIGADGRYVLCWLRQALRARDNPAIDAAVRLGNTLRLPVLLYHGFLRASLPALPRTEKSLMRSEEASC